MQSKSTNASRTVMVRLDPEEDILVGLRGAVQEQHLKNATIVSGVGSLSSYRVHVVETTNMPPGNVFFDDDGPFDILTMTGLVIDGQIHAHITFSNPNKAMGGHLEEGCQVLTFAIVVMIELPDTDLTGWDVRGPL